MRMIPGEDDSFRLCGLGKGDGPLQCDGASFNPLRASIQQKAEEGGISFFPGRASAFLQRRTGSRQGALGKT